VGRDFQTNATGNFPIVPRFGSIHETAAFSTTLSAAKSTEYSLCWASTLFKAAMRLVNRPRSRRSGGLGLLRIERKSLPVAPLDRQAATTHAVAEFLSGA
jgi:hypothetical protein